MFINLLILFNKYKSMLTIGLIVILISIIITLSFKLIFLQNSYDNYKNKIVLEKKDIEIENNRLLKEQAEKLNTTLIEFNNNQKRKEDEIKSLQNLLIKSNDLSSRLYKSASDKISSITDSTSRETVIRYLDVSNESYRETNDAYGEAAKSLELGKIELNKCISDINTIYNINSELPKE